MLSSPAVETKRGNNALAEHEKQALRLIIQKLSDLEDAVVNAIYNADYASSHQEAEDVCRARKIVCEDILRLLG